MSIDEIIAALGRAQQPSRELDLMVWRVVSGKPWRWEPRVDNAITWDKYGVGAIGNPVVSLDPYTSSLDAALTLYGPDGAPTLVHSDPIAATRDALRVRRDAS
jgi:hypothetical protein